MRLRITRRSEDRLEMDVGGEGHTLLGLLQSILLTHPDVKMAGFTRPHPLMDRSVLFVEMREGRPPEEALLAAAEEAKRASEEFIAEFRRSVEALKERA